MCLTCSYSFTQFFHVLLGCVSVGRCAFLFWGINIQISGTEAEAAEGLWGDLNAEDLETPFLLM